MAFVELPDRRVINTDSIESLRPNANHWRVTYLSGRTDDFDEEYAAVILAVVAGPSVKTNLKKDTRKTK